jgi:GNAT superfamily N-acetyltransferase
MFTPFIRRQTEEGVVFGAFIQGALVGVAGLSITGHCQPTLIDKIRTLPALLMASGPLSLWRVYRWTRVWARRDASTPPHWHLGPLAVEPQWQGQGIGSALLKRLCDQLDQHQALGYLETDRQKNVRLYERFGFTTVATEPVLGVMHWFMQRGH